MKIRTTRPEAGNKYYNRKANGGYSTCIKGKPTDKTCDVLANCVGNACAGFNEEHEFGYEKYHLNCNAENFIERAIASGLKVYKEPMVGGILVWQKGTLASSDGAGHVEIVIDILERKSTGEPSKVKTHSSGYGNSKGWWTSTRSNANNNWGANSPYKYRGCIAPEGYEPTPVTPITPNVERDETKNQIEVKITVLRVRKAAGTDKEILGFASKGYYNYFDKADASGYTWYKIAENQWIASKDSWTTVLPAKQPEPPKPAELKVGDKVQIIGYGNASSYGDRWRAGGIGWKEEILKIYKGRKFPYQVGNNKSTIGFYKANALKKL